VESNRSQLAVKTCVLLVPPLEQPTSPEFPAGVCTTTLKLPTAGIMDDVIVTVISELLTTTVESVVPLKIRTEEATKWLPVAVRTKLAGICEKTMVAGEIESRTGTGRALPQSGFSPLHPDSNNSTPRHKLTHTIRDREKEGEVMRGV
jgi:hypothetical protein